MDLNAVALGDELGQASGVDVRIGPLLLEDKLQQLTFEFGRSLATAFGGQKGAKALLLEALAQVVETLAAEAKLSARLGDGEPVDLLGAQHLALTRGPLGQRLNEITHVMGWAHRPLRILVGTLQAMIC